MNADEVIKLSSSWTYEDVKIDKKYFDKYFGFLKNILTFAKYKLNKYLKFKR